MDLEFYVRVRTCEKRVTGKQPLKPGFHPCQPSAMFIVDDYAGVKSFINDCRY